jgi:nucleoid DNA-binding protein
MGQKISWTELRRTIATRAGVSEKSAGAFLNSLNAQLIEALKADKQVKINGLGTFKLQAVAPRKSVNVASGEEMTIPGYNKVVFNAEAGVKELVEKNSAVLEAMPSAAASPKKSKKAQAAVPVSNDPLEKLGVQAAEIVDILGELGQNPKEEVQATPKIKAAAKPKQAAKKEKEIPVVAPEPVAEPEPVVVPEPIPFVIPESPAEPIEEPKKKKKHHFWRDTLICVIILLILACVAYYFFRQEIRTWINDFIEKNKTEQVKEQDENGLISEENAVKTPEETVEFSAETPAKEAEEAVETIIIEEQVYKKMLKTETITEGSRLAWIAKKYYGSKIYWPYLYDANKDHLSNPNVIVVGTPIRVPKLTALQKDTTNAQTMATIDHLRQEAEKAMR